MDKLIWEDEIEKIIADHYGLDVNDVCIHVIDGCRSIAIMPDWVEEQQGENT